MSNQRKSNKTVLKLLSVGSILLSIGIIALVLFTDFPTIIGIVIAVVIQVPIQMYVTKASKRTEHE